MAVDSPRLSSLQLWDVVCPQHFKITLAIHIAITIKIWPCDPIRCDCTPDHHFLFALHFGYATVACGFSKPHILVFCEFTKPLR